MTKHFNSSRPLWWQWLTVLSLDAPLVALLWQWMFAFVLGIQLPWHDPVLLCLSVWFIYAADRWIEGWRLNAEIVQTPRHLFYLRYRWPVFVVAMLVAAVIAVTTLTRVERPELKASFILLIPTCLYLFSHQLLHRDYPLRVPKEICIGVIFAVGCAFAPAVHAPERLRMLYMPTLMFGLLCFTNCSLISVWEIEVDESHGQTSLALQFKKGVIMIRLLPWCIGITGVAIVALASGTSRSAAICCALSGFLMGVVDVLQPRIGRIPARAIVDFTLMTPVLLLIRG